MSVKTKMIEFKIKLMSERHLEEVARLGKICFSVPWSKTSLKEEINNENASFLVAVDKNEKVFGYTGFTFVLDEGYITNIAVFPQYRGNGVAKKLLEALVKFAQDKKLKFISLEVRKSNVSAVSLYKKLNFLSVGLRKNFYSYPKEDAIIMTRYLN